MIFGVRVKVRISVGVISEFVTVLFNLGMAECKVWKTIHVLDIVCCLES